MLDDKTFLSNIKKRLEERQNRSDFQQSCGETGAFVYCSNDKNLTWEKVKENLIDAQNSRTITKPLSIEQLVLIEPFLSSNVLTSLSEIPIKLNLNEVNHIVKSFPVIFIEHDNKSFFLNLNKYFHTGQALELLLWPAEEIIFEEDESTQNNFSEKKSDDFETKKTKKNAGQLSLVSKFPETVPEATKFLKQHNFAAEFRHRNDRSYSPGVTMSQIREHLIKTIPGLKGHGLSLPTTRRLFQAPDSCFTSSSHYKGFIKARVGVKDNSYR